MPASERRSVYLIETYWLPRTPFCLSSGKLGLVDLPPSLRDQGEDLAGDVTFEDADDLKFGMALGRPLGHVGLGSRIGPEPSDGDDMQGAVGRPIASSVETMTDRLAGRGGNRTDATQGRKARCNRSALSPAVSRSCAAVRWPIEFLATRSGASSSTMAPIMASRSAISSCSSRYRRPRDFSVIR